MLEGGPLRLKPVPANWGNRRLGVRYRSAYAFGRTEPKDQQQLRQRGASSTSQSFLSACSIESAPITDTPSQSGYVPTLLVHYNPVSRLTVSPVTLASIPRISYAT
jgi:hypothetical protein